MFTQPALEHLAADLAPFLRPGDAVLLSGPLGAGKTSFARALIRCLSEDPTLDVPSPSYTLMQTYATARFTITHFDLWRLDGPAHLHELGWDDACDGVTLIEWPDRLKSLTPPRALIVEIVPIDEVSRNVTLFQALA